MSKTEQNVLKKLLTSFAEILEGKGLSPVKTTSPIKDRKQHQHIPFSPISAKHQTLCRFLAAE